MTDKSKKCDAGPARPVEEADTLPFEASPVAKALIQATGPIIVLDDDADEGQDDASLRRCLFADFGRRGKIPEEGWVPRDASCVRFTLKLRDLWCVFELYLIHVRAMELAHAGACGIEEAPNADALQDPYLLPGDAEAHEGDEPCLANPQVYLFRVSGLLFLLRKDSLAL